jgi:acetyl-CoA carboxylase biotin carboxylase subunit
MNTRIQVEHPVTELITGIDLVQEQIRVAAGEKLPFKQRDIELTGPRHRMPHQRRRSLQVHPLARARSPATTRRAVRACASIPTSISGYTVPSHYDSMIGKLITYGDSREQAIRRMRIALSEMIVERHQDQHPAASGADARHALHRGRHQHPLPGAEAGRQGRGHQG